MPQDGGGELNSGKGAKVGVLQVYLCRTCQTQGLGQGGTFLCEVNTLKLRFPSLRFSGGPKRLPLLDDLAGRPTGARVAGWPVGFVPLVPECAQGAEHPN